ncbi:MAG: dihydroorotase [Oscillospiraceae bacterium]|nr:dihydroorotase [Oscillospiraceae bacterium]MDY4103988.1 dihydroorotase [Oscillospiraceae bacterium]
MNYRFSNAVIHTDKTVKAECFHFSDATGAGEIGFSNTVHIFPGFCDVHVHFREPGFSYKETIASGSRSAARGGYTDVCTMPNLNPVPDTPEHLREQLDIIARDAVIGVHPYGAITLNEQGEQMVDMAALAPEVCAFSDDGRGVQSAEMMRAAMETAKKLGKIIAAHCEVNELVRGGVIHDGDYARAHGHKGICSESEWAQIERDIGLARETGCAYHVCHISTKEGVELIRKAKAEGVNITCETGPHYLVFCDEDLQEDGRFKMNPPLRSRSDRDALIQGIADGTIDMISTDHAPHSAEEKSRGLDKSAMGVVGLETAFAAVYTHLVRPGVITLDRAVELFSGNARDRFALPANGDFTVWDLDTAYTVDPAEFQTMGRATPFTGTTLYGRCLMTVHDGKIVWLDREALQ